VLVDENPIILILILIECLYFISYINAWQGLEFKMVPNDVSKTASSECEIGKTKNLHDEN
jgi:hypothetical protein